MCLWCHELHNDSRHVVCDRQRITYEPKWTVPLVDLSLDDKIAIEGETFSVIILLLLEPEW